MSLITPTRIIRGITGDVPVEFHDAAALLGGGCYDERRTTIKLSDTTGTSGRALAIAAHEAFHTKRHKEHTPFYFMPRNIGRLPFQLAEERVVNDLAEEYLMDLPLTDLQKREAAEIFALSRQSYNPTRQFLVLFVALTARGIVYSHHWILKVMGKDPKFVDEMNSIQRQTQDTLLAPGQLVDINGNVI